MKTPQPQPTSDGSCQTENDRHKSRAAEDEEKFGELIPLPRCEGAEANRRASKGMEQERAAKAHGETKKNHRSARPAPHAEHPKRVPAFWADCCRRGHFSAAIRTSSERHIVTSFPRPSFPTSQMGTPFFAKPRFAAAARVRGAWAHCWSENRGRRETHGGLWHRAIGLRETPTGSVRRRFSRWADALPSSSSS